MIDGMWNGYCGQTIRRINRNLLGAIVLIVAALGSLVYYHRHYMWQFLHGTSEVDPSTIVQHPVNDQFVRIRLTDAFNTGIEHTTTENGTQRVDSEYFVTLAGGKLLILRLSGGCHPDEIRDLTFEGRVRPLSAELNESIEKHRAADLPLIASYYVDGEDFRGTGIAMLCLVIPVLLFWLWMLRRYLRGVSNFAHHPFAEKIAKYGQLELMVQSIDTEIAGIHVCYSFWYNKADLTQNWLLTQTFVDADAIPLDKLTWVYPYVLKRKLYMLIIVGKFYFLDACDDMGKKIRIRLKKQMIESVLGDLAGRCPHVVIGYDATLDRLWKRFRNEPDRFLQQVRLLAGSTKYAAM
jgi:hypothetical protein